MQNKRGVDSLKSGVVSGFQLKIIIFLSLHFQLSNIRKVKGIIVKHKGSPERDVLAVNYKSPDNDFA